MIVGSFQAYPNTTPTPFCTAYMFRHLKRYQTQVASGFAAYQYAFFILQPSLVRAQPNELRYGRFFHVMSGYSSLRSCCRILLKRVERNGFQYGEIAISVCVYYPPTKVLTLVHW